MNMSNERGVSLVEVLIATVITGIVLSVLVGGTIVTYRTQNFTQQDSASLGALRSALDRFEKEVRQARVMYAGSSAKTVLIWVDYDRDNQQDLEERITWTIEDLGSDRAQLTRATDAEPAPRIISSNLVFDASAAEFGYNDPSPQAATLISVRFTARASGSLSGKRTVETEVRLRNARTAVEI